MKKLSNLQKRHYRVRSKVSGSESRPRLSVYKSSKNMFAQIINDETGVTIIGRSTRYLSEKGKKSTKMEAAKILGSELAKEAMKKGVTKVVFDRGGYRYHGRVKSLADAAREAGLVF